MHPFMCRPVGSNYRLGGGGGTHKFLGGTHKFFFFFGGGGGIFVQIIGGGGARPPVPPLFLRPCCDKSLGQVRMRICVNTSLPASKYP